MSWLLKPSINFGGRLLQIIAQLIGIYRLVLLYVFGYQSPQSFAMFYGVARGKQYFQNITETTHGDHLVRIFVVQTINSCFQTTAIVQNWDRAIALNAIEYTYVFHINWKMHVWKVCFDSFDVTLLIVKKNLSYILKNQ